MGPGAMSASNYENNGPLQTLLFYRNDGRLLGVRCNPIVRYGCVFTATGLIITLPMIASMVRFGPAFLHLLGDFPKELPAY